MRPEKQMFSFQPGRTKPSHIQTLLIKRAHLRCVKNPHSVTIDYAARKRMESGAPSRWVP